MSVELLIAIAEFCRATAPHMNQPWKSTFNNQLKCQKEYIHCVNIKLLKDNITPSEALSSCVLEKKK